MIALSALFVILVLVAVNALYVAAELGAVSVRRSWLQKLADDGNALAARLLPAIDDPVALDRYIAACQFGITLSSLVLGAYGQAALAPMLTRALGGLSAWARFGGESMAAAIVLVGLTGFQMVLGELVPKAFAVRFPGRAALYTFLPVAWSARLLSGLIDVLNGSALAVLRLFHIRHEGPRHIHSPREIDLLISQFGDSEFAPEEQARLRRALRLRARRARDLMVPRRQMVGIEITTPRSEVLRAVSESPFTRLPVYRGSMDHIEGILHTKDVMKETIRAERGAAGAAPVAAPVAELMRPALFIPASTAADRLLVYLREQRTQQAIVVDVSGRVAGLITLEDLLSEVFGVLADELKEGGQGRRRRRNR